MRIEQDLNLDFWDFACRWADPDGKIALKYAPHFHFDDAPETPYVICLKHTASTYLTNTTKCRFLTEGEPDDQHPLGQARCGIYGQRPLACRVFPAKLNDTAELALIHEVPERGRGENEPAYELCPTQWTSADLNPLDTMQNLVLAKYEMAFFHQLATIWNRSPQAWSVFPEFLRVVYQGRLVDAPEEPVSLKFPKADAEPRQPANKAA